MKLIERYVSEIARRLPKRQRDDVRQELESALGDALDNRVDGEPKENDVVELLREFGSPERVAASYRPENQYLIGPALYPTFRTVAGVVLTVLVSLVLLGSTIDLATDPPAGGRAFVWLLGLLSGVWNTALSAFAIVVLVFAVLQRCTASETADDESWDPRELPETRDHDLVGRGEAIVGIMLPIVFIALMNLFEDHFGLVVKPGGEVLLKDVFQDNLPWLNLALGLAIMLNAWLLRIGRWQWRTRLFQFAIKAYWIWVLFKVSGDVATRQATLAGAGLPEPVIEMIVRIVALIPWIATLLIVWGAATVIYRVLRSGGLSSSEQAA
jgi:hypothetical protein